MLNDHDAPPPPIDWGSSPPRARPLLLALAAIGAIVVTGLGVGVAAALYAARLAMAGTP